MRKFIKALIRKYPSCRFITIIFIIWRLNLELLNFLGRFILPEKNSFFGTIPWANFDGVHYLSIAKSGYFQYEQAFFPLYPLLIRFLAPLFGGNFVISGFIISNLSLLFSLFIFWKLIGLDELKLNSEKRKWVLIFFLFFPTAFFFGSLYTESLFLLLILGSFYFLYKKKIFLFAILASLSSAVRLVGAFLLVPVGLIGYMFYLAKEFADPLIFIHAQPAFGAGRSGGDLILLPQVYYRYLKIFLTVPFSSYDFFIAVLEFFMFHLSLYLLYLAWKRKIPESWLLFSLAVVLGPTLTGSLSSMPRYILAAFPIFIVLGSLDIRKRKKIFILFYLLFCVLTILFTRGYWIS